MICKALHIREDHLRYEMHISCWGSVSRHISIWVTDFPYSAHTHHTQHMQTHTCTHSQTEIAIPRTPSKQKKALT